MRCTVTRKFSQLGSDDVHVCADGVCSGRAAGKKMLRPISNLLMRSDRERGRRMEKLEWASFVPIQASDSDVVRHDRRA